MNTPHLNRELARILAPALPDGISLEQTNRGLRVTASTKPGAIILSGDSVLAFAVDDVGKLRDAILTLISNLQEFVAQSTTTPWPGTSSMPVPHVTIEDGLVFISFLDGGQPILTLSAFALQ